MAKILIIDEADGSRIPFLRGILTRSLREAGMSFEDAYGLATTLRQELGNDNVHLTTTKLRAQVLKLLAKGRNEEISDSYQALGRLQSNILIRDIEGQYSPFSRVQHLNCLESCGLKTNQAAEVSTYVEQRLIDEELSDISSGKLAAITYDCLQETLSKEAAFRYMVWIDYTHSGRPLILLIGGTTGSGKSTIATEVAHRLGIVRTQSTDMLREVMRMMIPERLLPALHVSSFDAWKVLPNPAGTENSENLVADGYINQANLLSVPCEAVVQRALRERVSLILEGVHVHPSLLDHIQAEKDAIVLPIMLAVLKPNQLRKRLTGRGTHAPKRDAEQQVSQFDSIWKLQSFLLSEADRNQVPIIANDNKEKSTSMVMGTIIDALAEGFSSSPEVVFGY